MSMNKCSILVCALLLPILIGYVNAGMFKCKSQQGQVEFSDKPKGVRIFV